MIDYLIRSCLGLCCILTLLVLPARAQDAARGEEESQLFYEMYPLNIGVFQRGRSHGNMLFRIVLEADTLKTRETLDGLEPRLRSAYISALGDYFHLRYNPKLPIDVTYVTAILQQATDKTLAHEHVAVLIQEARLSK